MSRITTHIITCVAAFTFAAPTAFADEASFTPLGFIDDADPFSSAFAISGDGSTIVGYSWLGYGTAFRWTAETGMVNLGFHPSMDGSNADSINYDGTQIAGRSVMPPTITKSTRWSAPDYQPEIIGPNIAEQNGVEAFTIDMAGGISDDGQTIVGTSATGFINNGAFQPYIWTEGSEGMVSLVPPFDLETTYGNGRGVSADGSVAVGWVRPLGPGINYSRAFRWTEGTGPVLLGTLGGNSDARALSPDGKIIVGDSSVSGIGRTAFRWTPDEGMVNLGNVMHFDEPQNTVPLALSADGSVIVGYWMLLTGTCPQCSWQHVAMIWDEENGLRDLKSALQNDYGLDLAGWLLVEARGVSADGRRIIGEGINPQGDTEAWLVELPGDDPTCAPADLNCDGVVDVFDLLILLAEWGPCDDVNECPADLDGNGTVDVFDLLLLLSQWG